MENKTIGEIRVRPEYRELAVEEIQAVTDFKEQAIKFIDACGELQTGDRDRGRLISIAQTKMEEAVMFAIKAVTQ